MSLESDLKQFTGTEQYHRHLFGKFTDGVNYLADKAGAYWLIDVVMSYRMNKKTRGVNFQVWELQKNKTGNGCVVTMKEDSDKPVIISQKIGFTDFPLDYIKLFLIDGILLLPSEY